MALLQGIDILRQCRLDSHRLTLPVRRDATLIYAMSPFNQDSAKFAETLDQGRFRIILQIAAGFKADILKLLARHLAHTRDLSQG